ncbi:MAG: DUF1684 domain-containing protein, partial [Pedobacter sp.]
MRQTSTNNIINLVASASLGASAYTAETLDSVAIRNENLYRTINLRSGTSVHYWDGANAYAAHADTRDDILHQYILRGSDNAPLAWKENWWDGTKYHNWTTDSLGFVANSKITAVSGGNGADTYAGGRYLDFREGDLKDGTVVLDFNKAYNP